MLGEPRMGMKPLAALCRRMSLSLSAGVDVRKAFSREAEHAAGAARRRLESIRDAVAQGRSVSDAVSETGQYFPAFFRSLVQVGEQTGHLGDVFRQLAEHYEHQLQVRRSLGASLLWPLAELAVAAGVVGLLIWLMGAIPELAKNQTDILGFGLTGTRGLAIYLMLLAAAAAGGFGAYRLATRSVALQSAVQRVLMGAPRLGGALQTLALARLTWAMHVTLSAGVELRKAMALSLESTHNAVYRQTIEEVNREISRGNEVHEALRSTGRFPAAFLDAVEVGEQSGQLAESMELLARRYQEEAHSAIKLLSVLLGMAVAGLIAAVILFLIFRIFSFYTGALDDALKGR